MQAINFEQNCAPRWGRAQGNILTVCQHFHFSAIVEIINYHARGIQYCLLGFAVPHFATFSNSTSSEAAEWPEAVQNI
jgi:hypothetical protein